MAASNWHLIVITGASRGFGRALAESFARRIKTPLHLVLAARSADGLEETLQSVLDIRDDRQTDVDVLIMDCAASLDALKEASAQFCKHAESTRYSDVMFVANAGVLGPLDTIGSDALTMEALENAYRINFLSPSCLISEFVKRYKSSSAARLAVINVSSLWAVEPAKTFSAYCASKAAMEMFMRTLAEETNGSDTPSVRVLNYAPGPLRTNMQEEIRNTDTVDSGVRTWSIGADKEGTLVEPVLSAEKCAKLVVTARYSSGAHVDYYD
ncbi:unnamed protein product, partial [Ectocarpus fasciculatus]